MEPSHAHVGNALLLAEEVEVPIWRETWLNGLRCEGLGFQGLVKCKGSGIWASGVPTIESGGHCVWHLQQAWSQPLNYLHP